MKRKLFSKYRMLLLLSSAWMIGAGSRFIIGYLCNYKAYAGVVPYWMNLFDVLVDWTIILILGLLLFTVTVVTYLREATYKKKYCKYLYADWCHHPELHPQENCYWCLYGEMENCNYFEEEKK
jgi:hypothetical protein